MSEQEFNYESAYHDLALIMGGILRKQGEIELTKEELINADGFVQITVEDNKVIISLEDYEE